MVLLRDWNAVSPTARLPNEIMTTIFRLVVDQSIHDNPKHPYGWIIITHVCQRWREIAIGTAGLWAHVAIGVDDPNPSADSLINTVISRSKGAPLTFRMEGLHSFRSGARYIEEEKYELSKLFFESSIYSRIHDCTIEGRDLVEQFTQLEFSPNSILSALTLNANADTDWQRPAGPDDVDEDATFGDPFPFPSLITLSLTGTPASILKNTNCPNLRVLSLQFLRAPLSATTYLNLLCDTPLLEELLLSLTLCSDNTEKGAEVRRVALPRLRSLTVWDNTCQGMSVLLRSLVLPARVTCSVAVEGDVRSPEALEFPRAFTTNITSRIGTSASYSMTQAFLKRSESSIDLRFLSHCVVDPISPSQILDCDPEAITTSFGMDYCQSDGEGDAAVCQELRQMLAASSLLPTLKVLGLSFSPGCMTSPWPETLRAMYAVEELLILTFLATITPKLYGTTNPTTDAAIFPHLKVLRIDYASPAVLNDFHQVLQERAARGRACTIQEVHVYGWHSLDLQPVERLRDFIPNVRHYEEHEKVQTAFFDGD